MKSIILLWQIDVEEVCFNVAFLKYKKSLFGVQWWASAGFLKCPPMSASSRLNVSSCWPLSGDSPYSLQGKCAPLFSKQRMSRGPFIVRQYPVIWIGLGRFYSKFYSWKDVTTCESDKTVLCSWAHRFLFFGIVPYTIIQPKGDKQAE